jgi:hypothetical protein
MNNNVSNKMSQENHGHAIIYTFTWYSQCHGYVH